MPKETADNKPQPEKIIQPTIVKKDKYLDTSSQVIVPEGKVYVVQVDDKGNEIPNSGFFIAERQYEKTYKSNKKFELKKKAGQ